MSLYKEILARFPRGSLSYVFAYGSAVKQQLGYTEILKQQNKVIDLIFCVKDPVGWHAENMHRHSDDYSALRLFGAHGIMYFQEHFGARVYFNTLVPLPDLGVTVKYGVVTREDLLTDLLHWRHLYLAGRLHKPVQDIVPPEHDEKLSSALKQNLQSALQVALLLLPARFDIYQLLHAISSLSYKGDFRMIFGENKQKVHNIVQAQQQEFYELYLPALNAFNEYVAVDICAHAPGTKQPLLTFEQNKSAAALEFHLNHLPSELQRRLELNAAFQGHYSDVVKVLASTDNLPEIVQVSVNDIVWRSSITQSFKNIFSAGLLKAIDYSYRKAKKTFEK